ncbi:MAG: hypothetical protein IKM61_05120 [Eubacteriaceae bacterium]|nr:hypothetical protein [Eubacteriaceae bacterium]
MKDKNSIYDELPSGLAMMLAQDTNALMAFANLTNQEKSAFVQQAREVTSRADMRRLVKAMSDTGNTYTG